MSLIRVVSHGFTVAELLISLLIIGEISTFTIPKIINSQRNSKYNAIAKEDFATVAAAWSLYNTSNTASSSSNAGVLTPYINYTKVDTSSNVDGAPGETFLDCSITASNSCLVMHNGSVLLLRTFSTFGGTTNTNFVWFLVDPDGRYTGSADSIWGVLYFNGRVTSYANIATGSSNNVSTYNPGNYDPSWFSW
jgi:type II secretory pathway pseudopilin PulG